MNETPLDPKRDMLIAALYGELPPEEQREFERLLADDDALRAEWQELQSTRSLLGQAAAADEAPELAFPILPQLTHSEPHRRRRFAMPGLLAALRRPALSFACGAAAVVLLMIAGLRVERVSGGAMIVFGSQQQTAAENVSYITQEELATYSAELMQVTDTRFSQQAQKQNGEMIYLFRGLYDALAERQDQHHEQLDAELRQACMSMIGLGSLNRARPDVQLANPDGERLTPDHRPAQPPEED